MALGKACSGSDPYQACVSVYAGGGCDTANYLLNYVPTCEGNCYQYPFGSVYLQGSFAYGVDCHLYSDDNCQNEVADSGNVLGKGCTNAPGSGKSMKCYHNC